MLALGAASAAAFARSRTMLALVLKRSRDCQPRHVKACRVSPSLVMPGFRGTPAGMRMTSEPVKHSLSPDGVGSYPLTVL